MCVLEHFLSFTWPSDRHIAKLKIEQYLHNPSTTANVMNSVVGCVLTNSYCSATLISEFKSSVSDFIYLENKNQFSSIK